MQTVFKRKEIKYLITREQYIRLLRDISPFTERDRYYDTSVSNIYFDTDDFILIRRSIEKPKYKEKLRLRCYGEVDDNSAAFIEIKKKYKGTVYKRRSILPYAVAQEFLYDGKIPDHETQIIKEIEYMKHFYGVLKPRMSLFYSRKAFIGIEDSSLRITVDTDIVWRTVDLDLKYGANGMPLLDENYVLLEIKCVGAMPLWLTYILDKNKIYPTSFSKYGRAYLQKLIKERK